MRIFQRRDLASAAALIATSAAEYDGIRNLGFRQPVAVIPNGVPSEAVALPRAAPRLTGDRVRTALFLSRIHPGKGLLNLLRAWSDLAPAGWRLLIAGPDDGGHLADVLDERRRLGLEATVQYVGALDGPAKDAAYRDADLFVLPTFSESFGMVVAEALAHGVPVITTKGAPWADLERFGCGWWVEVGADALGRALRTAIALTDEERRAMGQRGRDYVRRYDWDEVAGQTAGLYEWILCGGQRPECVRLD
jgi:glycosyltransferase involved in cell wall biosynthesis